MDHLIAAGVSRRVLFQTHGNSCDMHLSLSLSLSVVTTLKHGAEKKLSPRQSTFCEQLAGNSGTHPGTSITGGSLFCPPSDSPLSPLCHSLWFCIGSVESLSVLRSAFGTAFQHMNTDLQTPNPFTLCEV